VTWLGAAGEPGQRTGPHAHTHRRVAGSAPPRHRLRTPAGFSSCCASVPSESLLVTHDSDRPGSRPAPVRLPSSSRPGMCRCPQRAAARAHEVVAASVVVTARAWRQGHAALLPLLHERCVSGPRTLLTAPRLAYPGPSHCTSGLGDELASRPPSAGEYPAGPGIGTGAG
jgi:hypothetical protein